MSDKGTYADGYKDALYDVWMWANEIACNEPSASMVAGPDLVTLLAREALLTDLASQLTRLRTAPPEQVHHSFGADDAPFNPTPPDDDPRDAEGGA